MHRVATKTTALVATAAAVGFSSLFLGLAPASAAPVTCGNGATMLPGGVCELTVTATGATVFTPTAEVSQLEALLVAGGGTGDSSNQGYGAGGGGQVKVVGFADSVTPIDLVVGDANGDTTAAQNSVTQTATAGVSPRQSSSSDGGASGSGNPGASATPGIGAGAGGGAGGAAPAQADGGPGVTAASVAPAGSLFASDTTCYGGGGASASAPNTAGAASCGGGFVTFDGTNFVPTPPTANSGGGGSAGGIAIGTDARGASGVVVLRWVAVGATVTFDTAGRAGVAPQTVAFGTTVAQPADPAVAGLTFNGWFIDAAFTTPVDFSAPVTATTTYYASFSPVAAATVTVTFDTGGRAAVAPQTVPAGSAVARPADPIVAGFTFDGWFRDAAFTTRVDFSAPVTSSSTYFASFTALPAITPAQPAPPAQPAQPVAASPAPRALAVTGGTVDTTALGAGLAAVIAGAGLLVIAARRTRRSR